MESSQRKGVLTFVLATLVVVFAVVTFSKDSSSTSELSPARSQLLDKKTQILAMTSSNTALSATERKIIYESLAGEKVAQYNFTQAEKKKIITALNKKK